MSELKPCPFCGGEAAIREIKTSSYAPVLRIECETCHCSTGNFYVNAQEHAIKAWNRRDVYASNRLDYCPFCAGKPYIVLETVADHDEHSAQCGLCNARTPLYRDIDTVIAVWNRRAQS